MKFISFENQINEQKTLIKIDLLKRLYVEKHYNPESNLLILYVNEKSCDFSSIYECSNFGYDKFVSFLKQENEGVKIFKIDVMKKIQG